MKLLYQLLLAGMLYTLSLMSAQADYNILTYPFNNSVPYSKEEVSKRLIKIPTQKNATFFSAECLAIQVNHTTYLTSGNCAEQLTIALYKRKPVQLTGLQQPEYDLSDNEALVQADELAYLTIDSGSNEDNLPTSVHPLALYQQTDEALLQGRTVTYWSNLAEGSDNGFIQEETGLSYCDKNYCYLQHSSHNGGAPFFLDGKLLCIGLEDPSRCRRILPAHQLSKREGCCTTSESNGCTTLVCNSWLNDCTLCRDGKSCTIKYGTCDGSSPVRKILCSSGAQCVGRYDEPNPGAEACLSVDCDEGACGEDCFAECSFRARLDGGVCASGKDLDCRSGVSTWVVVGTIIGIAVTLAVVTACCMAESYYKQKGTTSSSY